MSRPALAVVLSFAAGAAAAERFDCVMDPSATVELASPTGGILAEVLVGRGDAVRAGDTVARLNSAVEEATVRLLEMQAGNRSAIEAERARLTFLEGRLERAGSLLDRGAGTREAVEEAQSEVETSRSLLVQAEMEREIAEGELDRARAALAQRQILSPIDGLVTELALLPGEYLHPEAHVVTVAKLDPIFVEAFLPVTRFGSIAIGDTALIHPAPPVEGAFTAETAVIDRVFDAASGTFSVRLVLPNPDAALPVGHRCTLELGAGARLAGD